MYNCKDILCFFVLLAICNASKKNPPLKQFEGPWKISNASENAVPILGNCPSMNIESSQKESSNEGVILFKSAIQTFTFTVVNIDSTIYQLFYPNGSDLLGNVSLLHAEKSSFLITELQTEGQTYYAVFTKENQTTPDANKKIDKIWKSSKPSKKVSLAPIMNESCPSSPQEETNGESNESTISPISETTEVEQKGSKGSFDGSTSNSSTEMISTGEPQNTNMEKSTTDRQKLNPEEVKGISEMNSTANVSTPNTKSISFTLNISTPISSQISTDKTITLPIVAGNDTKSKTKMRNSAESNIFSSYCSTTAGLLFLFIIKTVPI